MGGASASECRRLARTFATRGRMQRIGRSRRLAGVRLTLILALLAFLAGCGSPEQSPTTPLTSTGTVTANGVTLAAVAEPATVRPGEVIEVTATLSHEAPGDLELSGSGSGIVFFSVTRLEDGLTSGPPVSTGDCARHILLEGEPLTLPFEKSGGFAPDDPNAEFMEVYNATPELRLPTGTWRIDVATSANIGPGCAGDLLDLDLALVVAVTD